MKITWQKIKGFFLHFFTLEDTPHNIAAGAALGMLLGILPGEGLITTLVLVSLFNLNRAAATVTVLATNLWSSFAVLPMATFIGGLLFHENPRSLMRQFNQTYHLGFKFFLSKVIFFDLTMPLIIGFLLSATILSLAFYFILYYFLKHKKHLFIK